MQTVEEVTQPITEEAKYSKQKKLNTITSKNNNSNKSHNVNSKHTYSTNQQALLAASDQIPQQNVKSQNITNISDNSTNNNAQHQNSGNKTLSLSTTNSEASSQGTDNSVGSMIKAIMQHLKDLNLWHVLEKIIKGLTQSKNSTDSCTKISTLAQIFIQNH